MKKITASSPIGIFDSGLGGLSILSEICNLLPDEHIIYYADSANAPYGEKTPDEIIQLCKTNTEFLLSQGCKLIVVACNTATTNAINVLRETYASIPFIGIEPAIKPAILESKTGKIGVLATKGTLSSQLFERNSKKYNSTTSIIEVVGKGIVEAIESNTIATEDFQQQLKVQLQAFNDTNIDYLVLGCSHYPLISAQIKKALNKNIKIIDSGFAVAKQTARILDKHDLKIKTKHQDNRNISICTNNTDKTALSAVLKQLDLQDRVDSIVVNSNSNKL
jgi:glutamate racemase